MVRGRSVTVFVLLILSPLVYSQDFEEASGTPADIPYLSVSQCVQELGYDTHSAFFLYSHGHGGKFQGRVKAASRRSGLEIHAIDVGLVKSAEAELMECLFGTVGYLEIVTQTSPAIICLPNGEILPLEGNVPKLSHVVKFSKNCRMAD